METNKNKKAKTVKAIYTIEQDTYNGKNNEFYIETIYVTTSKKDVVNEFEHMKNYYRGLGLIEFETQLNKFTITKDKITKNFRIYEWTDHIFKNRLL